MLWLNEVDARLHAHGARERAEFVVNFLVGERGDLSNRFADAGAVRHTVQRGETLLGIAERYYGAGAQFERIMTLTLAAPCRVTAHSRPRE